MILFTDYKIVPVTPFQGSVAATVALKTLKGAHLRIFPASNEESLEIIAQSQRGKPVHKLQHDAASAEQSLELVRPVAQSL
jgi:hypothetical protein